MLWGAARRLPVCVWRVNIETWFILSRLTLTSKLDPLSTGGTSLQRGPLPQARGLTERKIRVLSERVRTRVVKREVLHRVLRAARSLCGLSRVSATAYTPVSAVGCLSPTPQRATVISNEYPVPRSRPGPAASPALRLGRSLPQRLVVPRQQLLARRDVGQRLEPAAVRGAASSRSVHPVPHVGGRACQAAVAGLR